MVANEELCGNATSELKQTRQWWIRRKRENKIATNLRSKAKPLKVQHTFWHFPLPLCQGMAQCWEQSPPTNVARVQFPTSTPYMGWVCYWFSPLLREVFSGYSSFPLFSKTNFSKFQFDQESGRWRTTLWMCYLQIIISCYLFTIAVKPNLTKTTLISVLSWGLIMHR